MIIGNEEISDLRMENEARRGTARFKYLGTIFDKKGKVNI